MARSNGPVERAARAPSAFETVSTSNPSPRKPIAVTRAWFASSSTTKIRGCTLFLRSSAREPGFRWRPLITYEDPHSNSHAIRGSGVPQLTLCPFPRHFRQTARRVRHIPSRFRFRFGAHPFIHARLQAHWPTRPRTRALVESGLVRALDDSAYPRASNVIPSRVIFRHSVVGEILRTSAARSRLPSLSRSAPSMAVRSAASTTSESARPPWFVAA